MFNLSLKDKEIIMKIIAFKPVTSKDVIANFIGNLLTRAGGDVADKVHLIVTEDMLYLEYMGHAAIGYGEEIRNIEEIPLSDLIEFSVKANKSEELIEVKTDKKEFIFVRDNSREDNLALAMSKVIKDKKIN
ncbi:MAG: hypothetical protein RR128_04720 [Clostridium sp.]